MLGVCVCYLRAATFQEMFLFFFWRNSPQWAMASSFMRFLDHTQRRTVVGRTPIDEWSALRTDLYLTTHNTHNIHTSSPRWEFFCCVLSTVTRIPRLIPYLFQHNRHWHLLEMSKGRVNMKGFVKRSETCILSVCLSRYFRNVTSQTRKIAVLYWIQGKN